MIISPTLANFTLNGLEDTILKSIYPITTLLHLFALAIKSKRPGNRFSEEFRRYSIKSLVVRSSSVKNSAHKNEILENLIYRVILSELNKYKTSEGKYNLVWSVV